MVCMQMIDHNIYQFLALFLLYLKAAAGADF